MTSVAFLGTGLMGRPMAANLARAGLDVRAWNRTPAKAEPLAQDGARVAADPAGAARDADVLITMLYDADAVADAVHDALPALAPGAVWAQMSTVGVEGSDRLARVAADAGVGFVDAPVLGTLKPAQDGTLRILASGPPDAVERLDEVFAPMGTRIPGLGAAGQGSRLKLAANAWVLMLTDGTAQSIALAGRLGLDPALFLTVIEGTATDTPYAHVKGRAMLAGDYPVSFALSGAAKDAALIRAAGAQVGADTSLLAAVAAHLQRADERGFGEQDMGAVFEAYR